jgi:alkylation response protein AidB-like acyl-CoA dehydrogenase
MCDNTFEDEALILDTIDDFLAKEVKPVCHDLEYNDAYPHEIVEKMKELGLFGAIIDPEYGGVGLPISTYAKIIEKMATVWMSITGILNSHLIMATLVQRFGTEEQKRLWLPKFATGEIRCGIALTEPDAGTDLQAIRTIAKKEGDEYIVNGSKTWITNALNGSCLALLVKTNPKADPRHSGMSMFIAEKREGMTVNKLEKLGYRGIDTTEIAYENYRVPENCLIGGIEGQGFKQIMAGLELGRINVAARGVGLARASLNESVAYSQERKTFGKPICQHQAIQLHLGEMATRVEAAHLLVQSAAKAYDAGKRCDMEAGMAKLFASEAAVSNSMDAMRIFGAYGYSKEYNIERYYRDAPLLTIGEGTNEIQRIIIARQLVERNPA